MIRTQLFIGAALLTGVAIGYFVGGHGSAEVPSEASSEEVTPARGSMPDRGEQASLGALRARIRELERELAAAVARTGAVAQTDAHVANERAFEPPRRGDPRARLEELKKTDPAKYAQITNRMQRFRARQQQRRQARADFLSSVDTSHMSAAAKKTHTELQDMMERREEIEEQLHQDGLTDAQRKSLMDELRSTDRELRRLNGEERTNLFDQTARSLGFSDDDVKEITQTLSEVVEATESGHGMMPPPGPSPGEAR